MKKGEHKGRNAPGDRGLYDYAEFVDTYGNTVTVRTSSLLVHELGGSRSADRPAVWIFCKDPDGKEAAFHLGKLVAVSPHLGVREAKLLRDALQRFIDEVES